MILLFWYCSLLEEGINLYKKGEFGNALKKIERFLLNKEGDDKTIPLALFLAAKLSKKADKAIKYYKEIIEKYPNTEYCEEALYELAQYWYAINDFKKAMDKYKNIVSLFPKGKYSDIAKNYINLISKFVFIQLGYFSQKDNAYILAEKIKAGEIFQFDSRLNVYILEDDAYYRVWVGIFPSVSEANKFIAENKLNAIVKQIK